jgi:hypothetical protein
MAKASGNVEVVMTGDEAKLVQSWLRVRQVGPQGMASDLKKAGAAGAASGKNISAAMAGATTMMKTLRASVIQMVLGLTGVHQATALIRGEVEKLRKLQVTAAGSQVSFGTELALTSTALGGREDVSVEQLSEAAIEGSETGVPAGVLLRTLRQGLGAKGADLPASVTIDTTLKAAELFPALGAGAPDDFQSLVDASLAVMKAFDERDPEKVLGGILQTFRQSRASDMGIFAKTIIPTVAQLRGTSTDKEADTFEKLSSIAIALGQVSEDPQSRRTSTAFVRLMQTVALEMKKIGEVEPTAGFVESLEAVIAPGRSEEAEAVRQALVGMLDPAIKDIPRILDKKTGELISKRDPEIGGELRQRGAMMQFFDPSRQTRSLQIMDRTLQKLDGLSGAAAQVVIDRRQEMRERPEFQAAELDRQTRAAVERGRLKDPRGLGQVSSSAEILDLLDRAGLRMQFTNKLFDFVRQMAPGETQLEGVESNIRIVEANLATLSKFGKDQSEFNEIDLRMQGLSTGQTEAVIELRAVLQTLNEMKQILQLQERQPLTITVENENGVPQPVRPNVPQ